MNYKYDLAVFIGRMCPPHQGHLHVMREALQIAKKLVVLVGSSGAPRSHRVPFTFKEREQMIYHSLAGSDKDRVIIMSLEDSIYNENRWVQNVQQSVERAAWLAGFTSMPKITLIGHSKDHSSYYLRKFPQWDSTEVENYLGLNSTNIRDLYFTDTVVDFGNDVPDAVSDFLMKFRSSKDFSYVCDEYHHVAKYKQSWANVPYPVTFVTVDTCVVQSGHVLLVKRRASPGKGLLAMPGGFINQYERIEDAAIRELREETGIKIPEPVLRGSIVAKDVFDDPYRSSRGRTITHAFLIKLRDDVVLPRVKGQDDAEKAFWKPIADIKREEMFEDHMDILQNLLARI